jgi:site-specific DNA recombinase
MPSVSRNHNELLADPCVTHRPRLAFYERVSTDEQSERDTIRAQDKVLHKTYDHRFDDNAEASSIFVGTFRDDGVSGTIPMDQRPEGSRMMAMIRRGEIDVVCVSRSDRLARDRGVAEAIAEEFSGREIRIESPNEHIDLTSPAGRLQFAIMCAFSHFEREIIRDRTMAGRETHAQNGEFINGPIPFGYDVKGSVLVRSERIIEELGITEADLVEQIFGRCANGESLLSIMRWLRAAGVPSIKRYYNKKSEKYKELVWPRWQHSRLLDIVNCEMYLGQRVLKYNKVGSNKYRSTPAPITQLVPALVSRDLFDRAKDARQKHVSNFNSPRRSEDYVYLLTGKLVCGSCGFSMIGNYQKPRKGHHNEGRVYYACSRAKGRTNARRTGTICPGPVYVMGDKLEELILERIDDIVARPERVLESIRMQQLERHGTVGQSETQKKTLRQRLAALDRGRSNLADLVGSGDLTPDEFRAKTAANAAEAAEVRRELELLESEDTLAEALLGQLRDAEQLLATLQQEWVSVRAADYPRVALREFLKPLIQRVVIHKDRSVEWTILFDNRSSDSVKLCNFISIGRPSLQLIGSLVAASR